MTSITKTNNCDSIFTKLIIPFKFFLLLVSFSFITSTLTAQIPAAFYDGNPADWNNFKTTYAIRSYTFDVANATTPTDDNYQSAKDVNNILSSPTKPSDWTWWLKGANDKGDITNAGAALTTAANGNTILRFFGDRTDNSGASNIGFWFLKNDVTKVGTTSGKFSAGHQVGDLLVLISLGRGGELATPEVYTWTATGLVPNTTAATYARSGANAGTGTPTGDAVPNDFTGYINKDGNSVYQKNAFFEGALDLTAAGLGSCFATFIVETRQSPSTSAALEDFAMGDFNAVPDAPTVGVVNHCDGTSTLTVTGLLPNAVVTWSDDANNHSNPRTVSIAGIYKATQTVNDCTSGEGSGVAAPKTTPDAPVVGVVDNCDGTSTLTVTGIAAGATITWTDDANNHSNPRTVSSAGTYSITQTLNGCTSDPGSAEAAPKTIPQAPAVKYIAPACDEATFSIIVGSESNPIILGAKYYVVNKNSQAIANLSPASGYTATAQDVTNGIITFSNIPAGAGYKVSVERSDCPSTVEACGSPSVNSLSMAKESLVPIELIGSESKVLAAPNPYNDKIRFTLQSNISGRGSLELFNMLGQKVKTVFEGQVQKGQTQTIDYIVPSSQRSNLVYVFRVGNEQVSGKLIGLKQ